MIAHSLVIARLEVDALPPALRALSFAILALQTSVQHVSLLTLTTAIEGFSVTLANAPSLAPLQAALSKVGHLGAAIDCLGQLVASAQRFNASVFSLPTALDSITGAYAVANASFVPVAAQVLVFNATMRSIEDAIAAAPNFTTILEVSQGWLLSNGGHGYSRRSLLAFLLRSKLMWQRDLLKTLRSMCPLSLVPSMTRQVPSA